MAAAYVDPLRDSRLLSLSIKDIRRLKGLSAQETARRMNMGLRTYQHFEAGRNKPNLEYINRFCDVMQIDLFALLGALMIGSPAFARRVAENKFMTILMVALKDYDEAMGDRIIDQDPRSFILAVEAMFAGLMADSPPPQDEAKQWIENGERELRRKRPKPGR
jgi:transcriptional regulator with XRE-family HTH domain